MLPLPYQATWTCRQESRTKVAKTTEGELLHAATYTCVITPGGATTEWTVDAWINTHRESPFKQLAGFRDSLRRARFKPTASLLDAVVPLFLDLPLDWDWHPTAAHPTVTIPGTPSAEVLAAVPLLMAVRGEIVVRLNVCRTLSVDRVTAVPAKAAVAAKNPPLALPLDWAAALQAGRAQIDHMLSAADVADHKVNAPIDLNAHLLELMCKADAKGLGTLLGLGLIDPSGRGGNPFRERANGYALEPDRSGDLNAAYNHLRFILFMEYLALRQMFYAA
ncbi:hypothetical protein [Streptacidiphilus jiangxiensis]|nr:hypothetical protein [Streptacidiphilus jiangxiensis]